MIKTIVTIGPNSIKDTDIKEFSQNTNLFRLNGSHNNLDWHANAISLIRQINPKAFILLDIPGIKPRTANEKTIKINQGDEVTFSNNITESSLLTVRLTKPLPKHESNLKSFSINDGQFLFDVTQSDETQIAGVSRESFDLLPKKGINLPNSKYNEEKQFVVYKSFLEEIKELDIDALGLSFVQTSGLVCRVKELTPHLILISKIENSEGLKNCFEIANHSDAIMIDRGDLVAEIGYQNLFSGIEKISAITKSLGKPLIMATENLESMIDRELPSKSEVISLAHSALIGVDCFMLSEETAVSNNKHTIVTWLTQFLYDLPADESPRNYGGSNSSGEQTIWNTISSFKGLPILIMSKSGRALSRVLSLQNDSSGFILTNNPKIHKLVQLYKNNFISIPVKFNEDITLEILWNIVTQNKSQIFLNSDKVLAIFVSKYVNNPRANAITILEKKDF